MGNHISIFDVTDFIIYFVDYIFTVGYGYYLYWYEYRIYTRYKMAKSLCPFAHGS